MTDRRAEIARLIWRETYRHDTLCDWHEIRPGTLHHQRTLAAADALAPILDAVRAEEKERCARVAERVGRPVGAGDGDTYVPGTAAEAAAAIRQPERQA